MAGEAAAGLRVAGVLLALLLALRGLAALGDRRWARLPSSLAPQQLAMPIRPRAKASCPGLSVLLHPPITGGGTLGALLAVYSGAMCPFSPSHGDRYGDLASVMTVRELQALPTRVLQSCRTLELHEDLSFLEYFPCQPGRVLTLLRAPAEHRYSMWLKDFNVRRSKYGGDIRRWIADPTFPRDAQLRFLAGHSRLFPASFHAAGADRFVANMTAAALDAVAQSVTLLAITEDLACAHRRLIRLFNVTEPRGLPQIHGNLARPPMPADVRRALEAAMPEETAVYTLLRQRTERECAVGGGGGGGVRGGREAR